MKELNEEEKKMHEYVYLNMFIKYSPWAGYKDLKATAERCIQAANVAVEVYNNNIENIKRYNDNH